LGSACWSNSVDKRGVKRLPQPEGVALSGTETQPPPIRPRHSVLWLVVAHGVLGLLLGALCAWWSRYSAPDLVVAVLVGIAFSQTSLLGIWGSLGTNSSWSRLLGVVFGVAFIGLWLTAGVDAPPRRNPDPGPPTRRRVAGRSRGKESVTLGQYGHG
jgi:hypothetical protein